MKQKTTSCLLGMGLLAAVGLTYGAERFSYSNTGSEVTDIATGLKWKRCPEGMTWGGNACTGSATKYTHVVALQHAQMQASAGWRLPNVKELSSIADRSRANPAIDPTAFPNTPSDRFWSSSPYVGSSSYAWFVYFGNGDVSGSNRNGSYYVRLVR